MNTLQWIRKYGLHLKKSFGQNFLNSDEIVQKIVDTALINKDETVIEIGPGAGTMTEKLALSGAKVIAYEADLALKELLTERFSNFKNVQILFEDFLRADLTVHPAKVKYVANIPYNISSPILQKIFSSGPLFEKAVLMVQKEFGERMTAIQGKNYSPLSIFVQYYCKVKEEFIVPRTEFIPSPKVDSMVVSMSPYRGFSPDDKEFFGFIHVCFSQRRKNIKNNLKPIFDDPTDLLSQCGIDPLLRPEQIPLEKYLFMYKIKHDGM